MAPNLEDGEGENRGRKVCNQHTVVVEECKQNQIELNSDNNGQSMVAWRKQRSRGRTCDTEQRVQEDAALSLDG